MLAAAWGCVAGLLIGGAILGRAPLAFILAVAVGGLWAFARRRNRWRATGVAVLACGAGALLTFAHRPANTAAVALASAFPNCSATGRVLEHAGKLGTIITLDVAACGELGSFPDLGPVMFEPVDHPIGSVIRARGWLRRLTDDTFDVARRRAGALAAFETRDVALVRPPSGAAGVAARFRRGLAASAGALDGDAGALLQGLTIGDTSQIAPALEDRFRRSGLAHLLAVSGANVAIVLGAVVVAARRSSLRTRLALCVAALTFFVLVVGPEPSVLRAAAMGALGLVGVAVGRSTEPLQALGVGLALLLAARPQLAQSVGLHLSVAATVGLVLWTRPLATRLRRRLPAPLSFALAAPLAAQAAVLPIVAGVFGQVSLVAPLANVVALPAVAPVTVLGLLAGAVGCFVEGAGQALAAVIAPLVSWILWVARTAGGWEGAAVDCPHWVGWTFAVPVVAAAFLTLRQNGRDKGLD